MEIRTESGRQGKCKIIILNYLEVCKSCLIFASSNQLKHKTMTTINTNIWDLKVGDEVHFTNNTGYKVVKEVNRIDEKSWYSPNRQSWGTLANYQKLFKDFKIIRK